MRGFLAILLLAVVAFWATSGPTEVEAQPTKQARSAAWEYKVIWLTDLIEGDAGKISVFSVNEEQREQIRSQVEGSLNRLGGEGWEICQELNGGLIFKRPG